MLYRQVVAREIENLRYFFEDCSVDLNRRELRRDATAIAVEPQVFDLLVFLIRNRDRVVSRDDLIATIWGGRIVSESALSTRINAARSAIGDSGAEQRLIKTLPRKGIRFVGVVREEHLTTDPVAAIDAPKPALTLPDRPSIAVLPFVNMSGDKEQEYFADGVVEDIITALSRMRWLFVIARNSSFTYKDKAVDLKQVGRELGVRYVLEGSIRVMGRSIRTTSQLIDAESGKHIWSEKYDRKLDDIFTLQDEITENVVAAIEPNLYAQEGYRAREKGPGSLDAWGYVAQAMPLATKLARGKNEAARKLLKRAIVIEPEYAKAHAVLSFAEWWHAFCWWSANTPKTYEEALISAERALALDPHDPWARMACGISLSSAGEHDRALGQFETALEHNPSFALAHAMYGLALVRAGRFEQAVQITAKALRMSPLDDFSGVYTVFHGLAHLSSGHFVEALESARKSVSAYPDFPGHYNVLISCCGHLGLRDEAKFFIERRSKIGPPLRYNAFLYKQSVYAHAAIFAEGLRKAGVPY
jgi:adenylate cyclase